MKRLSLTLALFLGCFITTLSSQKRCGADEYNAAQFADSDQNKKIEKHNAAIKRKIKEGKSRSTSTIDIPVAFHFSDGVTDEDICCITEAALAQIDVLNADFNALNGDISLFEELSTECDADAFKLDDLFDGIDLNFFIATSNHPAGYGLEDGGFAFTFDEVYFDLDLQEWAGYLNIFIEQTVIIAGEEVGGFSPVPGTISNEFGNGLLVRACHFGGPGISCSSGVSIGISAKFNLGRTAVHEVGHYFGLHHTFNGCDINNSFGDNIEDTPPQETYNTGKPTTLFIGDECHTTAGNTCQSLDYFHNHMDYTDDEVSVMFTVDQANVMRANAESVVWKAGTNLNAPTFNECNICALDINIEGDMSLQESLVTGNLIVHNGATLSIVSDVEFGEDGQLIIKPGGKVIVDGAILKKCPLAPSWQGVHVQSNWAVGLNPYQPGEIELLNGAVIQDAEIGIDAKNFYEYNGYIIQHGGGVVRLNNSSITNCDKGIRLSTFGWNVFGYNNYNETSVINNTSITNCSSGIFSDGSVGVKIENSYFNNILYDINASNSSFIIDGNTFNTGVLLESDSPFLMASTVINNYFYEDDIEVLTQGNFEIFNFDNNILAAGSGLEIEGDVSFDISNNDFLESYFGTLAWYTGESQMDQEIRDNYYRNNLDGNVVVGINDSEFLSNCFENSESSDIILDDESSIRIDQGDVDFDKEAGNCFENSSGIITLQNTQEFNYLLWEEADIEGNCKLPGEGNFNVIRVNEERVNDGCGSNLIPPSILIISSNNCSCDPSKNDCAEFIQSTLEDIETLEEDETINFWVKKRELAKLRRCLDRILKVYVRHLVENGDVELAITLLSDQYHLRYRSMAYGLILKTLDYDRAETYLLNMTENTQEEIDFKTTQVFHLNYLKDIENYTLTLTEKGILYHLGTAENPTSGYARSLYHKLTRERININHNYNTRGRNRHGVFENKDILSIYPNPSISNVIEISVLDFDYNANYTVDVIDKFGKRLLTEKVKTSNIKLDFSEEKGLYFIRLQKDEMPISTQKLIRL